MLWVSLIAAPVVSVNRGSEMGSWITMMPVINWVNYFFPSLTDYTHIIAPAFMVLFGLLSVFSKILPRPDHRFDVPDLRSIEAELKANHRILYYITRMSRRMTIGFNWVISTRPYKVMYQVVQRISYITRLGRVPKGHQARASITLPEKYVPHYQIEDNTFETTISTGEPHHDQTQH